MVLLLDALEVQQQRGMVTEVAIGLHGAQLPVLLLIAVFEQLVVLRRANTHVIADATIEPVLLWELAKTIHNFLD